MPPKGGRVPAIQGKQYKQRSDLQNSPRRKQQGAPPASGVGIPGAVQRQIAQELKGAQQEQAAQVVPGVPPGQPPNPDNYSMDSVPNISDPTGRPGESMAAGLGAQSEISSQDQMLLRRLQATYKADPSPQLADLIDAIYTRNDRGNWDWDTGWSVPGGDRAWGVI
jgi:hypothetical protein